MRIEPEHYETMRRAIIANSKAPTLLQYRALGLSEMRWRWDIFNSSATRTPEGERLLSWACREVYPYANDEHIDTALRKILGCPS